MKTIEMALREVVIKKEEVTQVWENSLPKQLGDGFTGKINVFVEPRPESDSFFYAQAEYKEGKQVHFELNSTVVNSLDEIYSVLKQEKVNKVRKQVVDLTNKNRVGFWLPYPFQFFTFKELQESNKFEFTYVESETIKAPPKAIVFEKYSVGENMGMMGQRRFVVSSESDVVFQREPLPGEKFNHSDYLNIDDKNVWAEKFKLAQSSQLSSVSEN